MAKPRAKWSESVYRRYLKEGRGQGTGSTYIPWLTIHSFESLGTVSRILGRTTGRIHHLLSHNEEFYFYLLDFNPDVTDIREQFPLDLDSTVRIAKQLGFRHPYYPGITSFPAVMTTDFLITCTDGLKARTIKMKKELDKPRVVEKFLIEQAYWKERNVDWSIVTEDQINRTKAENLVWLYTRPCPEDLIADPRLLARCEHRLLESLLEQKLPFTAAVQTIDYGFNLPAGSALSIYKALIRSGTVIADMNQKIQPGITPLAKGSAFL